MARLFWSVVGMVAFAAMISFLFRVVVIVVGVEAEFPFKMVFQNSLWALILIGLPIRLVFWLFGR